MKEQEESPAGIASRFINSTERNIFLTGKAGTGKTTFLRKIIEETHKKALIVAPTGIAAINAGGVTIHSLFQLPFGAFLPERGAAAGYPSYNDPGTLVKHMQMHGKKRKLIQELELLIIDEVSMLRADILDAIDNVLKSVRKKHTRPFGGVQVLFIGDLLQLPPVVKDQEWQVLSQYYPSIFFFDARVLRDEKPYYIELDKIYRQSDSKFINLLNNLRTSRITKEDEDLLNTCYRPGYKASLDENYIYLTTHNSTADSINQESLKLLKGKSYFFKAAIENDFPENSYPVETTLELKSGAQVMFIKNDMTGAQRYFNGKIGKVKTLNEEVIEVGFDDGTPDVSVERYTWENVKYDLNSATNQIEERVAGVFYHYPIKLAWAITVHKSQGLTFSKAVVDIGQAFAPGQVYVALSRLRSLDGLILTSRVNFSSLRQDVAVSSFSDSKKIQEAADIVLKRETSNFVQNYLMNAFDFSQILHHLSEHLSSFNKNEDRSVKQRYQQHANALYDAMAELRTVAEKFRIQLRHIGVVQDNAQLKDRVQKASSYFIPLLKDQCRNILKQIEAVKDIGKSKTFLGELLEIEAMIFGQIQKIRKCELLVVSLIEDSELKKDNATLEAEEKARKAELDAALFATSTISSVPKKPKSGKKKQEKGSSQKLTYELYKQGKTILEIAAERKMTPGTIETHLTKYIAEGVLDVTTIISREKIDRIIECSRDLEKFSFSALKEKLGKDYTFSEIKLAMASADTL